MRPGREHKLGQQALFSSLPGEMVEKSVVRMLRHREEVFPRPSGAGEEQEDWALSCRCLALAGHPQSLRVQQKALQTPWQCL